MGGGGSGVLPPPIVMPPVKNSFTPCPKLSPTCAAAVAAVPNE